MPEGREILVAGAAHLALLAALSMTWAVTQRPTQAVEAVPVEIVDISDIARVTEPPKPSMRAAPQEVVQPTAPEPQPEPEPTPPQPEPEPVPEPKPRPPEPEPAKPQPAPEPKPVVKKPAEKAPPPKEKPPEKVERVSDRLDAQQLADLIDKSLPKASQRPRNTSETATSIEKSVPAGAKLDARATATLEQAIRSQVAPCWNPPLGGEDTGAMTVVLGIRLARDGSVLAPPEILSQTGVTATNRGYARSFAESARRAVLRCAPLKLPPEMYDAWKEFELNFDPSELA
jgi:outer membrane biosynthesis protein TonB